MTTESIFNNKDINNDTKTFVLLLIAIITALFLFDQKKKYRDLKKIIKEFPNQERSITLVIKIINVRDIFCLVCLYLSLVIILFNQFLGVSTSIISLSSMIWITLKKENRILNDVKAFVKVENMRRQRERANKLYEDQKRREWERDQEKKRTAEKLRQQQIEQESRKRREEQESKMRELERERKKKLEYERRKNIEYLKNMNPVEFEKFIAELFSFYGYKTRTTQVSGDNGVDIFIYKGNYKYIIQCKRYKGTVGAPDMRDFYGTLMHERAKVGFFITTGHYSEQAKSFAKDKPIELIDGGKLVSLVSEFADAKVKGESSRYNQEWTQNEAKDESVQNYSKSSV